MDSYYRCRYDTLFAGVLRPVRLRLSKALGLPSLIDCFGGSIHHCTAAGVASDKVGILIRRQLQAIQQEGDGTINCNVCRIH
jgi:hypothetical protein